MRLSERIADTIDDIDTALWIADEIWAKSYRLRYEKMKSIDVFIKNNEYFSCRYLAAIRQLGKVVDRYPSSSLENLDFSVYALAQIFKEDLKSKKEVPLLIEALCNLEPQILSREYWFVEGEQSELVGEDEVYCAHVNGYFPNPFTGEKDFFYQEKIGLRYVLSSEVLKHEY